MAKVDIDVIDLDMGYGEFVSAAENLDDGAAVTVGVHKKDAPRTDNIGMNNAELLALHEFGGVIKHPGGTPYVMTDDGPVFVSEDHPNPDGHTDPHTIEIPPRRAMRGGLVEEGEDITDEMGDQIGDYLDGNIKLTQALTIVGVKAARAARSWFGSKTKLTPNAPETIRQKGHSKPMIGHTGQLKWAIDYQIKTGALPEIGLRAKKSTSSSDGWSGLIEG